jgi:hypothetical protein
MLAREIFDVVGDDYFHTCVRCGGQDMAVLRVVCHRRNQIFIVLDPRLWKMLPDFALAVHGFSIREAEGLPKSAGYFHHDLIGPFRQKETWASSKSNTVTAYLLQQSQPLAHSGVFGDQTTNHLEIRGQFLQPGRPRMIWVNLVEKILIPKSRARRSMRHRQFSSPRTSHRPGNIRRSGCHDPEIGLSLRNMCIRDCPPFLRSAPASVKATGNRPLWL